jgi:BirA family biotin operon repressor/biotin-[acetyl-CoA-carboxylase] ligase
MTGTPDITSYLKQHLKTRCFGKRIHYLASTGSTMDVARDMAVHGAETGTAVIAGTQKSGRGRLGRTWFSPEGSLAISIIVRPAPGEMHLLPAVSSLAVFFMLKELGIPAKIKWPNDVLIAGKKVSGILIESQLGPGDFIYSVIGIGINVDFDLSRFPEIAEIATSISAHITGKKAVEEIALKLLGEFESIYAKIADVALIRDLWLTNMETIGRSVRVNTGKSVEEGIAETVNYSGNLILRRHDNSLVEIVAGDVTLIKG